RYRRHTGRACGMAYKSSSTPRRPRPKLNGRIRGIGAGSLILTLPCAATVGGECVVVDGLMHQPVAGKAGLRIREKEFSPNPRMAAGAYPISTHAWSSYST